MKYDIPFCPVVSLKTDSHNIFSLEDYNEWLGNSFVSIYITIAVVAVVLTSICVVLLCKRKKHKTKEKQDNKQSYKKLAVAFIICLFLMFGMICNLFIINLRSKQTENKTNEFTATVNHIAISDTHEHIEIHIDEYKFTLSILPDVGKHLNKQDLDLLSAGTKIYFCIDNETKDDIMNENLFVCPIVALRTDKNNIFLLSDYNKWISESLRPANITSTVFVIILLTICIIFLYKMKKMTHGVK